MIHQYISKLKLLQGTLAEPTIHDVEDATTGVNWFEDENVGFVAGGTSSLRLASPGYMYLASQTIETVGTGLIYLNRNLLPNTGSYSSIDFRSNAVPMTSLRSMPKGASQYAFQIHTAGASFNTLPAFVANYNNNIGFNIITPQFRLHQSDEGTALHASLLDANSLHAITSSQLNGASFTLISSNVENTTRGVIKGVKTKGTLDTPLIVSDTNYTLSLLGAGYDGANPITTAGIHFQVTGTPATNVMPQSIIFETGNANTRTERMRITQDGNVGIFVPNPVSRFSVRGGATIGWTWINTIAPDNSLITSRIGIGTPVPGFNTGVKLHCYNTGLFPAGYTQILLESTNDGPQVISFKNPSNPVFANFGFRNSQFEYSLGGIFKLYLDQFGCRYEANYHANYTLRSLVDKEYVDNAIAGGGGGGGITSLNGLTPLSQTFATSTSGSDFTITSSGSVHTFNLPNATALSRGLVSELNQDIGGTKSFITAFKLLSLSPNLPLKLDGTNTAIAAAINLNSIEVTGILPIANGGTGSGTQGWVDLTTNQTINGTKRFSTNLFYAANLSPLPHTSAKFGTIEQTIVHIKGGSSTISESNFNDSQALLISNEVNAGSQQQTVKIIAAGSDAQQSGADVEFYTRRNGLGHNWAKVLRLDNSGAISMSTTLTASTLNIGATPLVDASILMQGQGNWKIEAPFTGTEAFRIVEGATTRAHIIAGNNGWQVASDSRLKKEIEPVTVLPLIKLISAKSYKLIDGNDKKVIGVIAQEIEQAFPELVSKDTSNNDMRSVSYDGIAAIALQACKELKEYIDILENRITKLEKQLKN